VQPALEDAVSVLARVSALARSLPVVRARHGRVIELARVSPARLLPRVGEGALGPVVRARARASLHLEVIHAKVVAGELRTLDVKDWLGRVPPIRVVILVIAALVIVLLLLMYRERIHPFSNLKLIFRFSVGGCRIIIFQMILQQQHSSRKKKTTFYYFPFELPSSPSSCLSAGR
jgi:hypothetical protein